MKIKQMIVPAYPLEIRFEKFAVPMVLDVEYIALVEYDGECEIEYGAIIDGHMMNFNVDGSEVAIQRKSYSSSFHEFNMKHNKKRAEEGYRL
jgi:hypothetical protein